MPRLMEEGGADKPVGAAELVRSDPDVFLLSFASSLSQPSVHFWFD